MNESERKRRSLFTGAPYAECFRCENTPIWTDLSSLSLTYIPRPRFTFYPSTRLSSFFLFSSIYISLSPINGYSSTSIRVAPLSLSSLGFVRRARKDGGGGWCTRASFISLGYWLCRTRSLECGFLHVFVSEARNSVCPRQLLEPGHGSSPRRNALPIASSKASPPRWDSRCDPVQCLLHHYASSVRSTTLRTTPAHTRM